MRLLPKMLIMAIILAILIPAGVSALVTYNGGEVLIDHPVQDDVFATGGTVTIDAPVASLIAAGGMVNINASVIGDVIVAGGTVNIGGKIGGKVVAAGGTVNINQEVGTNAVVTGGTVTIGKSARISRDALISGGTVTNAGEVKGNLTVRAQSFTNTGTAGNLDIQLSEPRREFSRISTIFGILFTIGMFILGLVLLRITPTHFLSVEEEVRTSPLLKTMVGFVSIIVSFIILILASITIVLLPITLILGMVYFIALILATLFVSLAFGRIIFRYLKKETQPLFMFIVGFIVLGLIFLIPVVGFIILVIAESLGFGAILFTIRKDWNLIRGPAQI